MLILSGKYGLLAPEDRISWYDLALTARGVRRMTALVTAQMAKRGVTAFIFYAKPRETPGWLPYHRVLEGACQLQGVPLEVVPVNEAGG